METNTSPQIAAPTVEAVVRCCKSCELWNIKQAQDKIGRVRKDAVARCLWTLTEPLPSSVMTWGKPMVLSTSWMGATYGTDCACWRPRTSKKPLSGTEAASGSVYARKDGST